MNLIASRDFNLAYIILDCIFLLVFILLLTFKKKYLTVFGGYSAAFYTSRSITEFFTF